MVPLFLKQIKEVEMKSFKVKVMALLVVVVMALTGCGMMDNNVTINKDGSGKITSQVIVEKDYVEGVLESQGIKGQTDQFWAQYKKEVESSGIKAYEKEIDGKDCYVMESMQKLRKGHLTEDFGISEDSYISKDTFYFTFDINEIINKLDDTGAVKYGDYSKVKFRVNVELPANIVNSNGTIDKTNSKKVSFEGDFSETMVAFATSNKSMTLKKVKGIVAKANKAVKTKIRKITPKKTSVKINYKKVKGHTYQIQYSKNKNFRHATTVNTKKSTYTIKKLKKGTKYYVRVRTAKKNMLGNTVYSKWVKKSAKTKKK